MQRALWLTALLALLVAVPAQAKDKDEDKEKDILSSDTFSGLAFRGIGPALTSGRVGDFAIDPTNKAHWYVAVCSGNVWETRNAGTTWKPIFDSHGSYSIGCIAIDPQDPLTLWLGTGENNSQRSVGYGDGLYKSVDGGKSWKKVGLENSEHIGDIWIDPRNTDIVFVAAQGPLWNAGGDRGLYRTADGGKTWEQVLAISDDTGCSDLAVNPADPDEMYVSAYQRRRHVWCLLDGGPEGGIYKSEDGGATWNQLKQGLPSGDVGRIGLAVAPGRPNTVYAIVEAADDAGGFYRSDDAGASWRKTDSYISTSPQYYQEIVVDPNDPDVIWSLDTVLHVSRDGGQSWDYAPIEHKHVDDHALWIDPCNSDHMLVGCDGGIYETWEGGDNWRYIANLPITQFYRVSVDDDLPFYNIYGGTQDNNSMGGPSRTTSMNGITNEDWTITRGGDGFETVIEPGNPDVVYSQAQYGALVRYDRKSGERIDVTPMPDVDDPPLKWNWNSPLIISPHSPTRLYFGCQMLFRSDDRGNSWTKVSGDLTQRIDRNKLEIMGRVWSVDAVAKNHSTSYYGTLVSLSESPLVEGLIYTGSDDGQISVTEDGGRTWRTITKFKGVPERSYVAWVYADRHDPDAVYAAFDNHKMGDYKPYLLKSTDRGKSWTSISGDLPERGTAYTLVQDHVKPDLLFCGTEFGVFFTIDGGGKWMQLKAGIPTIAVYDLEIQRRESDLVAGTFGRGFYVLDDYSPLRQVTRAMLENETALFPVKDAWMYFEESRVGGDDKGSQGAQFYTAPNPPYGTVFTYYLHEELKSLADQRQKNESDLIEAGEPVHYPPWEDLRAEEREEGPEILLTVTDEDGNVVRRLTGPTGKGFHRVAWDMRYPPADPVSLGGGSRSPWWSPPSGSPVAPGTYQVTVAKVVRGETTVLAGPEPFALTPLGQATLPARDREALVAFQRQTARLQRAVLGAVRLGHETQTRIDHLKKALFETPDADPSLQDRLAAVETRLKDLQIELSGDRTVARRQEPTSPAIDDRVTEIVWGHWRSSSDPTQTQRDCYRIAAEQFGPVLERLRIIVETDLPAIEREMEAAGAPWTPGRVPTWSAE